MHKMYTFNAYTFATPLTLVSTDTDPFRDVYDLIWDMLEAQADFLALFPHGTPHQVRYNTTLSYSPDPEEEELSDADYPRCRITAHAGTPDTYGTSSSSIMTMVYRIEICTGQQYQGSMHDICWAIFRASLLWLDIMKIYEWNGLHPVVLVEPMELSPTDQDEKQSRGTKQWIAVWLVRVTMEFSTETIKGL